MEEGPHRTGPDWVSRPVSCFLKMFFSWISTLRNEAPERGGRKELLLESQEDQELSAVATARQLVLNMSSEDQTVDHTYMLMGNENIYVRLRSYKTLTSKITRQHLFSGLMTTFQ